MAKLPSFEELLRRATLALTVALPCLFGFLTTYLLLVLFVPIIGWLLWQAWRGEPVFLLDRTGKTFLVGYFGLAAVIVGDAVVAGHGQDIVYVLDFGMLLLYSPLASLYDRGAKPGNAAIVADFALAGVVVATIVGGAEIVVFHPDRAGFITNDPIRFGDTALILGFLSLMGVLAYTGPRRWVYLAGPLLAVVVGLMSGARSALVAVPILAVLAAIFLVRRRLVATAIGIGAVAVFGAAIGLSLVLGDSRVASVFQITKSAITGAAIPDGATEQRFALYRAGIKVFEGAPLFGVGWHRRMEAVAAELTDPDKVLAGLPHLHDEVLNFGVGAGVVGVLVYLLLISLPIVTCLYSPRDSQYRTRLYGCVLLVASYVILGLADVMIGFELHTALYVALTALLLSYCRDRPAKAIPAMAAG